MRSRWERSWQARAPIAAVAIVILCIAAYYPFLAERYADFRAFYCSGRAVLAHADPYREHPLRECEHSVAAPGVSPIADISIPSPFPGYALAIFAALAMLPFGAAASVWLCASLVAVAYTVRLVARLTGAPWAVAATVLAFPSAIVAIQLGQITPFVGLAMVWTATLLAAGKPRSAALAALPIALEPHVALPIFLTLLGGVPRMRVPLVLGILALGAVALGLLGSAVNVEYVRSVLPAHALANIPDIMQLSAAHIAYAFGVPLTTARAVGSVWYAVASAIGIAVGLALRPRLGAAALVLVPPAFAVFGGVYIHYAQMLFALPAFLLLLGNLTRPRVTLATAIFVAAMPWITLANYPMLIPALAVLGLAYVSTSKSMRRSATALALGAAILATVLAQTSLLGIPVRVPTPVVVHTIGNPLADVSWGVAMLAHHGYSLAPWFIAAKAPTFLAFVVLLSALVATAARPLTNVARRQAGEQRVFCRNEENVIVAKP